ncbi:hypothetical protein BGZ51_007440 [Haplosporangium sp. Z 767]|nr:hypothetical protein BGZ51_007440 [Haplosporangium sp. Z 767]
MVLTTPTSLRSFASREGLNQSSATSHSSYSMPTMTLGTMPTEASNLVTISQAGNSADINSADQRELAAQNLETTSNVSASSSSDPMRIVISHGDNGDDDSGTFFESPLPCTPSFDGGTIGSKATFCGTSSLSSPVICASTVASSRGGSTQPSSGVTKASIDYSTLKPGAPISSSCAPLRDSCQQQQKFDSEFMHCNDNCTVTNIQTHAVAGTAALHDDWGSHMSMKPLALRESHAVMAMDKIAVATNCPTGVVSIVQDVIESEPLMGAFSEGEDPELNSTSINCDQRVKRAIGEESLLEGEGILSRMATFQPRGIGLEEAVATMPALAPWNVVTEGYPCQCSLDVFQPSTCFDHSNAFAQSLIAVTKDMDTIVD